MSKRKKTVKPKKIDLLELSASKKLVFSRKPRKNCGNTYLNQNFGSHLPKLQEE